MRESRQRELTRFLKVNQRVGALVAKYRIESGQSAEEVCSKIDLLPCDLQRFEAGFSSIPAAKIEPILNILGGNSLIEFAVLMTNIIREQQMFIESHDQDQIHRLNFEALGNVHRFPIAS